VPQLDVATFLPQIFWLAVLFALLYGLVSRVALPRVSEVLQARRERVEADLGRARALSKEAEETLAAYEAAMAVSRAKAHALIVEATQAAAAAAASRNEAVTAELAAETAAAEARIAEAGRQTEAEMQAVARELVRAASGRLAGIAPGDAAIERALAAAGETSG